MKVLKVGAASLVLVIAIVIIVAPIGPLPGFFIRGTPTEVPAKWPDTSSEHEIMLQVGSGLPRVVIIWMVEHNDDLYVIGATNSGWVQMIGDSSPVRMRLVDSTFDLVAERVTGDLEAIATAYRDKYEADYPEIIEGFPPITEADDSFRIFRLMRPASKIL